MQNHFLKFMILLSAKTMISLSVIVHFSSVQIADAITSENLIETNDPRITQLLATHYDCSIQYNLRQFSLTWVQKCTQAPSEKEFTGNFASVFIRAKVKKIKAFRCSATIQKTRVFCVQGAHNKNFRHDRMN